MTLCRWCGLRFAKQRHHPFERVRCGFLKQMAGFDMELHPGAARYWKERGILK